MFIVISSAENIIILFNFFTEVFDLNFYPPASGASEWSKLVIPRRYKFHPICFLPPICIVLLSVCHEFVPNYFLIRWSDLNKFFFTKTRENLFLIILFLKFTGQHRRFMAHGRFWRQINFELQFWSNSQKSIFLHR